MFQVCQQLHLCDPSVPAEVAEAEMLLEVDVLAAEAEQVTMS
jgi:hypothetical protein